MVRNTHTHTQNIVCWGGQKKKKSVLFVNPWLLCGPAVVPWRMDGGEESRALTCHQLTSCRRTLLFFWLAVLLVQAVSTDDVTLLFLPQFRWLTHQPNTHTHTYTQFVWEREAIDCKHTWTVGGGCAGCWRMKIVDGTYRRFQRLLETGRMADAVNDVTDDTCCFIVHSIAIGQWRWLDKEAATTRP